MGGKAYATLELRAHCVCTAHAPHTTRCLFHSSYAAGRDVGPGVAAQGAPAAAVLPKRPKRHLFGARFSLVKNVADSKT